jgi:predicted MFS family arabinose efflux permease
LGISVVAPLALSLIGRLVPASQRLAAISRASVIGYGAFFFGPPLMGLISEGFGLRTSFVAVAFLLTITAVALIPALARRAH